MAGAFGHESEKHVKIGKENTKIVGAVGGAAFVVIFALFSIRVLVSQSLYQNRIIEEKGTTLDQLSDNINAAEDLRIAYQGFANEEQNVIGGDADGDDNNDGDNAKIVLDALPSVYDYPGLASSIEKVLTDGGYGIDSVGGSEDTALSGSTDSSAPINIPYPFSVNASPADTKELLVTLERSIRPIYVDSLVIRSSQTGLRANIGARTFYQPAVDYQLESKVVQ